MARHRLSDEQWELIENIFPKPAATGRPPVNPRDMMDAILWRLRTGSPWRDLPEEFGPWKTVFNHFDKWNSDGTLDEIKRRLLRRMVNDNGISSDLWCVDGTVVRAARCAAGGGKKGNPMNRTIMREAGPAAAFPRRFLWSARPKVVRFTLNSRPVKLTKTRRSSICSTALTRN